MTRQHGHEGVVARYDAVEARPVTSTADVRDVLALLDRTEATVRAPLVDEAERARLERAVAASAPLTEHHHGLVARRDGRAVGYAGMVLDPTLGGVADVAVDRAEDGSVATIRALLGAVSDLAALHEGGSTDVWIRHAGPHDITTAIASGYAVGRRLAVLGRSLDDLPSPTSPGAAGGTPDDGVRLRAATAADADAIVAVLDAAYRGSADGGWTPDRFATSVDRPWFRFEDIVVADDGGDALLGVHWTKRRDATTGEVHNLAVRPGAQGRRLGRRLLDAGLDHLAAAGCDTALLWVDLANEFAVRLYVTAGFTARWEDVALRRHVRPRAPLRHV